MPFSVYPTELTLNRWKGEQQTTGEDYYSCHTWDIWRMGGPAFTKSLLQSYPNALSRFGVTVIRILPFSTMVPVKYHPFKGLLGCHLLETEVLAVEQTSSDTVLLPKRRSLHSGFGPLNWYVNSLKITTVAIKCTLCFLCTQWDKSMMAGLKRSCKQSSPGSSFFLLPIGLHSDWWPRG